MIVLASEPSGPVFYMTKLQTWHLSCSNLVKRRRSLESIRLLNLKASWINMIWKGPAPVPGILRIPSKLKEEAIDGGGLGAGLATFHLLLRLVGGTIRDSSLDN